MLEHSEPHTNLMGDRENSTSVYVSVGHIFAFCYWHWYIDPVPDLTLKMMVIENCILLTVVLCTFPSSKIK